MNKNSYMRYGIRVEVMELETIEIKEATKEVADREGQSPLNKMQEKNDLIYIIMRLRLTKRRMALNNIFLLKKTLCNKT